MKKPNLKKNKKKAIIIVLIIAFVLITIVKPMIFREEVEPTIETEIIEKRKIAQSISATGTIKAENSKSIFSTLTGYKISTVNVKEGDYVSVGDVICTFDTSKIQESLSKTQSSADITSKQANIGVDAAQRNLDNAVKSRDSQIIDLQKNVASAQTAYEEAQKTLNSLNDALSIKNAQLSYYTAAYDGADDISKVEIAKQKGILSSEIPAIQQQIAELQPNVENLRVAYEGATKALDQTSNTLDSTIASLQDNLENAQLSIQSAQITEDIQTQQSKTIIEDGVVKSTVSGTITAVNVKENDLYTGTEIATINGIDELIVETQIDEYDIADIAVGMRVLIKTEATRDEELEGKISYVALSAIQNQAMAATMSNDAKYKVKISLNEKNSRLRLGMNAKISIITVCTDEVLSVPYDAVHERDDGTNYIEIMNDDETIKEVNVEKGLEGSYYMEIKSDEIKEGMKVVLPETEEADSLTGLIQAMGADAGI